MRRNVFEKTLAGLELLVALLLLVVAGLCFYGAFLAPAPPAHASTAQLEGGGWSLMMLIVSAPLSAGFALAGVTLWRGRRGRWWCQLLPALVLGVVVLLGIAV